MYDSYKKAKLVLEDGTVFSGYSFGYDHSAAGEVVFNTGMTGYPETLTDPSYRGQILVLTYPLVGNYGVPEPDYTKHAVMKNFESPDIQVSGVIISDYSAEYSHWTAKKSLGDWLKEFKTPGIFGIDTRALTKKLREKGVMLGKMMIDMEVQFDDPNKRNLVSEVSIRQLAKYGQGDYKIVLVDCGVKNNIINCLLERNTTVMRVPWNYDFTDEDYHGILISNGPGDPKMCKATIENVRKVLKKKIPVLGICLGNQIVVLAAGGNTYKLKYGHRSQNQPCIDTITGRCYITSQNHGYAVDKKSLPGEWKEWFVNANDQTNEGIMHRSRPIKTVQFHPEATPGPVDTRFIFDDFMETVKKNARL
ncbi:glutamine-hydrolyzing carbamoyl-phosphate synthase small subunit [Candidatus Woesearchaeota archaeon]|nr:glutamine-hydrolyzing carbamoyl-phosphate synthase small subunit [Candidatus Woesearchaeota archaeon]